MNRASTLFLKVIIYCLAFAALGVCTIIGGVSYGGNPGMYLPILLGMAVTAIPFFIALYQALLLLHAIDKNTAFSAASVRAITTIKYCAFAISAIYAAGMPYIFYVADKDDAPGVVLIGLVCIFAPLVMGVFAAVLEKLFQNALDIKSENDLTV